MKLKIIILTLLISCGCTRKNNNYDNSIDVDTLEQSIDNNIDNVKDELRKHYQRFNKEYYNDLNFLGIGIVNPQNYNFQIIIDTATGEGFHIDDIENQEYLIPVFWKPDYRIFYMPVINVSSKYYEIQANTEKCVFVKKEEFNF